MFRTVRRIATLALAPVLVVLVTGTAHAESSAPAVSEIVVTKAADNTFAGTTSVNAGILLINNGTSTAVIAFTGLEAVPARTVDGSTSYLWTFQSVRVDTTAPTLTKVGSGTLVLNNGAAATVRVNNLANLEALLNTTTGGQDLVLAAPDDPTEIGLLLPAVQKVREAA